MCWMEGTSDWARMACGDVEVSIGITEGKREPYFETEDGVVVLVAAHRELGRGVEGRVERDQNGAVFF